MSIKTEECPFYLFKRYERCPGCKEKTKAEPYIKDGNGITKAWLIKCKCGFVKTVGNPDFD